MYKHQTLIVSINFTKLPWRGIFAYSTKETKLANDLYCLLAMKQLIARAACEHLPILRENILFMQYIHNSTNILSKYDTCFDEACVSVLVKCFFFVPEPDQLVIEKIISKIIICLQIGDC